MAAPIDGILVSRTTYLATKDSFVFHGAEPVQAKGKAEPIEVWEVTEAANGSGPQPRRDYQGRGAKSPTEYLEALGVLGPRTLLAHALGLDDAEIDCVARTGAAVTMCPVTAAKGARGVGEHGRMPELLARRVRVALGCDSPNNSNHLDLVRAIYRNDATAKK